MPVNLLHHWVDWIVCVLFVYVFFSSHQNWWYIYNCKQENISYQQNVHKGIIEIDN